MSGFTCYSPGKAFPSVSLTGNQCALGCSHCDRKYLKGMLPAETPGALLELMRRLRIEGAEGFLLSGGFNAKGSLDLSDFTGALAQGKRETGLLVNVHPGMQSDADFEALADAGADCASLDLLDEPREGRRYPLDYSLDDYIGNALRAVDAGLRTVPHVTVGMNASPGRIIDAIPAGVFPRVIVNTLVGEASVGMTDSLKEATAGFVKALAASRKTPEIVMGCMRPRGDAAFEAALLDAGACGIANPGRALISALKRNGIEVRIRKTCCSL